MLLVYGLLFLRGAYFPRLQYLWGGLGVVAVLAIEWGSYMAYGESPLYRFMTSAQSHGTIGIRSGDFNAGSGNISDNRLWGPLLALLVNQEFGLLFYAAPVAVFGLLRSRNLSEQQWQLVKVFSFSALVWFLWVGYSGAVRPLPRYFAYDAFIALILVGAWLACVVGPRWRIIVLAGLVLSNYAFLSVENIHPRFSERSISAFAMATDEKIATDPLTNRRVGGYFRIEGRDPKEFMNTAPNLEEGSLYAYVDGRAQKDSRLSPLQLQRLQSGADQAIWRAEPPLLLIGTILTVTGLDALLPPEFFWKLAIRNPTVAVYRLGARGP